MALSDFSPLNPWYKTRPGIIFFSILGFVFLCSALFLGLVVYYAIQIREGKGQEIGETLRSQAFTLGFLEERDIPSVPVTKEMVESVIRSANPVSGNPEAKIAVLLFIDFECPFCQKDFLTTKELREQFGPAARFVFKHFPLSSIHPNATSAAIAAQCAHEQDAFWGYHDTLFQTKTLDESGLLSAAETIRLDMNQFAVCRTSKTAAAIVDADFADGVRLGVRGTPTYFVNGQKIEGVYPMEVWEKVMVGALGTKE